VPAGTSLRQMCSLGFAVNYSSKSRRNAATERYTEWENVFCDFPDLGWDYFQHIQKDQTDASSIKLGGACRFHDHSDIFGWVRGSDSTCPYPHSVLLTMREYRKSFGNVLEESADERRKEVGTLEKAPAEPADEPAEEIGIVEALAEPADEPVEEIGIVDNGELF
jgi:hypothetical protein